MPILTEKAAVEIHRVIAEQKSEDKLYLRLRVEGGGCSGFQNKLDLDTKYDATKDEISEQHGVSIVIDKRSALYANEATIDFVSDLNKRGFSIVVPGIKSTCGCGQSYSM